MIAAARAAAVIAMIFGAGIGHGKSTKSANGSKPPLSKSDARATGPMETYQDLILKAQNLSLQQDRLQAGQVLIRGIERESKGSIAQRELIKALDDMSSVFYTEKAQSAFANAEALLESRPREAIDLLQESLKIEDRNVTTLKALARAHLRLDECDRADVRIKHLEDANPYSPEIKLLRLQALACHNNFDEMLEKLGAEDFGPMKVYLYGLQLKDAVNSKDFKKSRAVLADFENKAPDYPEAVFWRWEISRLTGAHDRVAATRYVQLCLHLTPRKRKQHAADVALCRAKDAVEEFLRKSDKQIESKSRGSGEEPRP